MSSSQALSLPQKPDLTFPKAEAAWIRDVYDGARVILEYGSGGSTVIAGELLGATVFSVENDLDWAANMTAWFSANPPLAHIQIHIVDIGPTKRWGLPADASGYRNYPTYPVSVWDRDDFQHPDVVLIDGRFRPACFVTTMLRTTRPVTVLFDDYTERTPYHMVERYSAPAEIRGRMARFNLEPRAFPPTDMAPILNLFTNPL